MQPSSAGLWQAQMAATPAPKGPYLEPFGGRLKTFGITVSTSDL